MVEFRSNSICMKLFNVILNSRPYYLQNRMFSITCGARLDYLQCLKFVIKTVCISPVWLIFHRHDLILEKQRER